MADVQTVEVELTSAEWRKITDDANSILVQLQEVGRVKLWFGTDPAEPDPDSFAGMHLTRNSAGSESSFGAGGFPLGTSVWGRVYADAGDSERTEIVNVLFW